MHRDLDTRHDAVVMKLLAPKPLDRPADTFAARRALSALVWPKDVEHAALKPRATSAQSERPSAARLQDGDHVDAWTSRSIERVALTPQSLGRAGAFARANVRSLQLVLRVDRDDETIWLEAAPSKRLDRPLNERESQLLLEALDALHAHGVVHGHVDREHVALGGPLDVMLLFDAASDASATADTDFTQLRRLASR